MSLPTKELCPECGEEEGTFHAQACSLRPKSLFPKHGLPPVCAICMLEKRGDDDLVPRPDGKHVHPRCASDNAEP